MLWLIACAGMPPAWWNPRAATTAKTPVSAVSQKNPAADHPVELNISLQDETYEEMTLTPLQDEEEENASGDASAQSVGADETEDVLPAPSILQE